MLPRLLLLFGRVRRWVQLPSTWEGFDHTRQVEINGLPVRVSAVNGLKMTPHDVEMPLFDLLVDLHLQTNIQGNPTRPVPGYARAPKGDFGK